MKEGELRDYCRWNQIDNVRKILKNSYKEIDILHDEGVFFRLAISKSSTEMLEILLSYFEKLMKEKPEEYIASKLRGVLKDIEETCDISSEIHEVLKSREYLASTEYSEGEQGRLVEIRGIKPKADLEEPEGSMLPSGLTTQKDSDIRSELPLGLEALHLAVRVSDNYVVKQILDRTPEIVAMPDEYGQTALHLAADRGDEEIVRTILKVMKVEDITKATKDWKYTALHVAVRSNNDITKIAEIVEQILDKAPKIAGMPDKAGQTPLHWAADRGDAQVVEYLINKMTKEDLLKKTNNGHIALCFAKSEEVSEKMIKLLKDKGLNLKNEADESDDEEEEEDLDLSLDFTTGSKKSVIIDKNGQTALHLAIMEGSNEIAKEILQKNPEIASIRDKNGQTALHLAIMEGSNEIAKEILELNPRIADIKDKLYGQTALHLAITIDNNEIVEQILSKSPYAAAIEDRYGQTALHLASGKPSDRIVKQILKECPHIVGIQDREGFTALHRSAVNVNEDIVLALLEVMKSEDITKVTRNLHYTVLHMVIYSSNTPMEIVKIAKHILKKVPELAPMHDDKGNTALHAAISKGYKELIEQILELNSELASMPNKAGQTALYLAASNGNEGLCELLINKMSKTAILKELENGLIELLPVKTPKREEIIKLLQEKSIDVSDKLIKTSKHVEIIDVGVTDHRVGEKRLVEHGFHQRKTLSDILKVISKIIAQYAQEELYQDEIAIFYKDSMGLNNKLLERQMKEVSNAIKFTAHLGTEQISGVDCGPFALENMRIMAKAITSSRENLFRAFDQFKEFCSLIKAKELRKGEFAEQYVLGVYQEMINEAIKAAKLHKIREQHFSEVEEITEKLKKVEFFQDINIRPLVAREYLGETINTMAVEIITNENTDPDRCDYSYGYRISFSRNLADRIKEIKKNIKLVFSGISDFGEETIIVSADEITSIDHKPKAAIRNYDVAPVKIEELFKNLNITDSSELQQEVQKILINKLLKNYISSFAVLDIIYEYLDVSPLLEQQLLVQQIEIYKNLSIKQDIEIEQNAFNQKNNSHYYYKSSDIRMIQQEIMSPYLDSVIIYEPLGDKISVKPFLEELIRSLDNNKATLCIYNLSNSHWIVFAALKTGSKTVIEELEQNASIIEVEKYAYEALSIFADQENVPVQLMGSEVIVEEVV